MSQAVLDESLDIRKTLRISASLCFLQSYSFSNGFQPSDGERQSARLLLPLVQY